MNKCIYETPPQFSNIIMISNGEYLTSLYFQKDEEEMFPDISLCPVEESSVFIETKRWLDCYFGGSIPDFTPCYSIENATPFRREVIDIMSQIPYGKTMTYKEIADIIAENRGIPKMSAQAVGGAVGRNPIGIIIPCHRVIGSDGSLTGYNGGLENKKALLELER